MGGYFCRLSAIEYVPVHMGGFESSEELYSQRALLCAYRDMGRGGAMGLSSVSFMASPPVQPRRWAAHYYCMIGGLIRARPKIVR